MSRGYATPVSRHWAETGWYDEKGQPIAMKKLAEFITEQGITATSTPQDANTNMADEDRDMHHYLVTLRRGDCEMKTPFSMGRGLKGAAPTAEDVLSCLASDSAGVENAEGNFEEWCSEYGLDSDSRKAERTFHTCESLAEELKAFLGEEAYEELLWETEH